MSTFKTFFLLPLFLLAFSFQSYSIELSGDQIIGVWLTKDNKAKIQIYKVKDRYFGKIISGDLYEADGKTLKKDTKNENSSKRNATIKDLVLLNNFSFEDGIWSGGTIYDPESGSTYSCKIKLKGTKLEIRGYIGISLFGRTEIWQRA